MQELSCAAETIASTVQLDARRLADACSRSIGHRVATGMLGPIRIPKSRPSSAAPELADYVAGLKQRSRG